jgi:molybdopterin synthase catalytic subunit
VSSPCEVVLATVSEAPTSAAALHRLVAGPDRGAVVTFDGVVRDHDTPGRGRVRRLDYEAHPSAGDVVARVAQEVAAGSRASSLAVVHRVGALEVGDCALAVAVAAAHRGDAFATAAALVDAVKAQLPVWKHQHFVDGGEEWVGLGGLV